MFERVQEWVFAMDQERGTSLFRIGMFFLLVLFVILLYTGSQFFGLRDKEAMDMGQIARNLYRGAGYSTKLLRPLALAQLRSVGKLSVNPHTGTQPELFTPPAYPGVLALVFKVVQPDFQAPPTSRTMKIDRLLMIVAWVFFVIGLVLMYLLAREMFDHRVGALCCFLYLLCDPLLDASISGLHLDFVLVLLTLAAYGAVKGQKWHTAGRSGWWIYGALLISALAVSVATLTQYTFLAVVLPWLVYVGLSFPTRRMWAMLLCLAVMGLVWLPWVGRNYKVSRTFFGLTKVQMYEGTGQGDEQIKPGELERTYASVASRLRLRNLLRKAVVDLRVVYETTLKDVGANWLIAFFAVSLLHRWRNEEAFRLRRFVFWSLLLTAVWLVVVGPPKRNYLVVFQPLIIIYAAAFFYVLFERLQLRTRLLRFGLVGLFVAFNAVPVVDTLLPPATKATYPPYNGFLAKSICKLFEENALLASDIPESLVWYGDRTTLLTPYNEEDYIAINDNVKFISGLYMTQATLANQSALDLVGTLISGKKQFWLRVFPLQSLPATFPLKLVQVLTPDRQQFLISNIPPPPTR